MTYAEGLSLYFLEQYGIPREVLETLVFEHGGDSTLLEIQSKGIQMGLCDPKKLLNASGIISGPTGSGKTLLAELRMLIRWFDERRYVESGAEQRHERGKTIFLVPMKAIGLEKLRYFRNVYGRFGIKVLYSDGDIRYDDGNILRGQFHAAIIVNEKLKYFAQHNPEFFKNVGEVVVDELGIISEKSRGPQLEIAITGLLRCPYKPVVLALTAPLEIPEELLRLMNGFLLETKERPIDIRAGVWIKQKVEFHSWSCSTWEPYPTEKWDLGYPADIDKMLKELVLRYKKGVMFAVPSKALALSYANRLWQLIDRDQDVKKVILGQSQSGQSIQDRLQGLESTRNKVQLNEYLKNGIGFHHADLTVEERREVEDAFRNREISVLFCTSTLARGINLPAEAVIFLDWGSIVNYGEQTYPNQRQLCNEFSNWMGRVGRPGNRISVQPVAIYLAQTSSEAHHIKKLILTKRVRISTHLADTDVDLTSHLLSACSSISNSALVKAKSAQQEHMAYLFSLQDIREFFSCTPSAANEDLKCLLLSRATNRLISLVNPHTGTTFVNLRKLVYKLLNFDAKAKNQSIRISGGDIPRLVYGLESLPCPNVDNKLGKRDVIKELENTLRNSIVESLQNSTLFELARIFRDKDIHQHICRMITEIQGVDKRHLARSLGELGELLKQDHNLSSIPNLKQKVDRLAWRIVNLVEQELGSTLDRKGLSWLDRIRVCQLDRQLLIELESLLESDEFIVTLLHPSADDTTDDKILPRYLNWVKANEKQGFMLTNFGRICSSHGISTETCDELYKWLSTAVGNGKIREINEEDFFRLILCTFDGALVRLLKTELPTVSSNFILIEYKGDRSKLFL